MAFRRVAARQRNQVGFAPIVQLAIPVGLGMVVQHALQPLFGVPPLVRNTVRGDVSRATTTWGRSTLRQS